MPTIDFFATVILNLFVVRFIFVHGNQSTEFALDVVIALDSSRSISRANWIKQIDIIEALLPLLKISNRGTHVGLIDFSNHVHERIRLIEGLDTNSVITQLEIMRNEYEGGSHTYTDDALIEAMNLFKHSPLSRNAPPVLIILTDGKVTSRGGKTAEVLVKEKVAEMKAMGVTIFCISFGDKVDMNALHYTVGEIEDGNIFTSQNFNITDFIKGLQSVFKHNKEIIETGSEASVNNSEIIKHVSKCNLTFIGIGCFFDHQLSPRPVPDMIMTDRDPTHEKFSGRRVDWENWKEYTSDLVCRCAVKAKETRSVIFGVQFYGVLGLLVS